MRIIIIGCGRWGSGLVQVLERKGHAITVVDHDPANFARLEASFKGRTIEGVGFDRDILIAAGIEWADGLAATTPSDETNFVSARAAREIFHVPHVVARIYDPRKADLFRRMGLHAVTPALWGINRVAELLCYWQLDTVGSLGSGEVDLMECETPEMLVNHTVNELTVPGEIQVVAISRSGKTFMPTLGTRFQAGDRIHLSVLTTSAERLTSLLGLE